MRKTHLLAAVAFLLAPALSACGGDRVSVQVLSSFSGDSLTPVTEEEVQFLPYDRDAIFERLTQQAEEPEPPIPDTLRTLYAEIAERQQEWRDADARWQSLRDSLRRISERMEGVDEASGRYRQLYQQFTEVESQVSRLERQKEQAFSRFDSLQKSTLSFSDSIRILRETWAEDAFRDYLSIVDSVLEERGREVRRDTTDNEGWASAVLPGGDWWVHTRIAGPYEELYWNVRIQPGQVDTLRLTPEDAEVRLRL